MRHITKNTMAYKINKKMLVQKVEKETVLINVDSSELYTLNETASYVYACLKKKFSEEEIVKKMSKRFDKKEIVIAKDVQATVKKFLSFGIIAK